MKRFFSWLLLGMFMALISLSTMRSVFAAEHGGSPVTKEHGGTAAKVDEKAAEEELDEDTNGNGTLDPGEDKNGNGVLDTKKNADEGEEEDEDEL